MNLAENILYFFKEKYQAAIMNIMKACIYMQQTEDLLKCSPIFSLQYSFPVTEYYIVTALLEYFNVFDGIVQTFANPVLI